jgi:hypothetical protein
LDVEQALAERYQWCLYDLDRTDIESLFPFFFHLARRARHGDQPQAQPRRVYCDQADWL